ncbi:MAG: gfo/Idh/MocA family oxidoreductase, partial [Planctomycetota bacterium]
MSKHGKKTSRRQFLRGTAGAATAFTIVPCHVLAGAGRTAPSNKLNIAIIGTGGRGGASVKGCDGENIVALCDVDINRAGEAFEKHPGAKRYQDFRKMLDEMDNRI